MGNDEEWEANIRAANRKLQALANAVGTVVPFGGMAMKRQEEEQKGILEFANSLFDGVMGGVKRRIKICRI